MSNDQTIPTPEAFGLSKSNIAYVCSIAATDVEEGVDTPDGIDTLYALHDAAGKRLALFDNREFAFEVAKQNDLVAFSSH